MFRPHLLLIVSGLTKGQDVFPGSDDRMDGIILGFRILGVAF